MALIDIAVVIVVIMGIIIAFLLTEESKVSAKLESTYLAPKCHKIGEDIVLGPEDMSLIQSGSFFLSSHNRRNLKSLGNIFLVDSMSEKIEPCEADYTPPYFRPHGIATAVCNGNNRLYVVSHRFDYGLTHTIEVFDNVPGSTMLQFVKTLSSDLVVSPNDLIALGCDELIVSNDHSSGFIPRMLFDDILKLRMSTLVHYDGKEWHTVKSSTDAAFGNGLIVRDGPNGKKYLLRASSADYSLLTYAINREPSTTSDRSRIALELVHDEKLPISPDNIEYDPTTDGIIIAGHPSTAKFVFHALFHFRAPSAVLLYHGYQNFTTLYYDSVGTEMSASSVAVRSEDGNKIFIGQVFEPFILVCETK